MPNLPGVRRAHANFGVAANSGGVTRLRLPKIDGQVLIPVFLSVLITTAAAGDDNSSHVVGLSHYLDHPVPTMADFLSDTNLWVVGQSNGTDRILIDLRPYGVRLAGPQRIVVRQESANAHDYRFDFYYQAETVNLIEWARTARATSFED